MDLFIRKAKEKDAPEVSELLSELINLDTDVGFLLEQIKSFNADPKYYFAVACMDGHVVGMAIGILCQNILKPLSPFMVVENVVVASAYRKQGIGRKTMLHLENWAVKNDCGFISLVSQHKRREAHRFYEALGYEHDDGFQKFL